MDNYAIADNFSMLSKLMDIHGDNSFKAKSYSSAAFAIEKLPMQLSSVEPHKIFSIKGIGESVGKKILEQLQTGTLLALQEYVCKTPPGVIEMLNIKGIGPKKIATIWKDMEVENLGELLYACEENRLTLFKGFGEKTQQSVKEGIEFYLGTIGSYLYQQIENYCSNVDRKLNEEFLFAEFILTAAFRRQLEIIEKLEWVTTASEDELKQFFINGDYEIVQEETGYISFKGKENVTLGFFYCEQEQLYNQLFATSCSEEFLKAWLEITGWDATNTYTSEEEIFEDCKCSFIPACRRENASVIELGLSTCLPTLIEATDIKGIIHCHSKWSDGLNTIEEMAKACIDKGYEYLVISDHSKTAFYAQGLPVEKIRAQHVQIDELNAKYPTFKIFKSIESDILGDGSLDYDAATLATFDIVIASVHSNLKMTEEKAMMRLMNAIANPFTSILGHMTGRLLLSRGSYPINHKTIIEACAANNVVIELNAHPRRLDMDWRWIDYALQKNVLISIDPDAHNIDGYEDCKYGVLVAQKGGLTKDKNLSSFNLAAFEKFVAEQKMKRK
ncbi:MAG: DNA polymerase/3'-5' exonuclease PolX [Chitinophagaceae bacterium]|nr:DNA polymerase/3'-5' exonuclease PolX [Chitinophagaceae bacterium]